jgi:hypothetical protein
MVIDSQDRVYVAYRQIDSRYANIFISRYSPADGMQIWNRDPPRGWTPILASGDPIGLADASGDASAPRLAMDSADRIYVTYTQNKNDTDRLFLSRFDGASVQIWSGEWQSARFAAAQPIDSGETRADRPRAVVDAADQVYIAYGQLKNGVNRIHLTRWNGIEMEIWNAAAATWTTTFSGGGPIDAATGQTAIRPAVAVDGQDRVYIAYQQTKDLDKRIYLSRYNPAAIPRSPAVEIWRQDDPSWTTRFSDGDPIDAATGHSAYSPQVTTDRVDTAFVAYPQNDGTVDHIYLSAYEDSGVPLSPPASEEADTGGCFIDSLRSGPFSPPARSPLRALHWRPLRKDSPVAIDPATHVSYK